MKVPFLGQAYQSRSPVLASQTAVNIFAELIETNSDEVGAFYGTPGLVQVFAGSGEVRGLHMAGGYLFAVIGATVYRIASDYSSTNLGTLPNSSGRVSMAHNDTQVAIAHTSGWHYVAINWVAIAAVAGSPPNSIITAQDTYVLFTKSDDGRFGLTALDDLSSIDPLDVATAEGQPDDLVAVVSDHREAWLFGTETTEIWSNTGAAFFPFERAPGGFIEQGCAAKWSPAKIDNSLFWLGRDTNGRGVVYRANAYAPQRISTHAIEFAISGYSDISDAIGYSYQQEGHSFYVLTFPTGDATWVYDVASKGWHQRAWLDSTTGILHRHRGQCYATFNGDHLVGDWQNGIIYRLDLNTYTDNGAVIYRERAFELPDSENNRIRLDILELLAIMGDGASPTDITAPQIWLQISRDAGQNFGYQRIRKLGKIGQTRARAIWRHMGFGRSVVLRIATTMSNRVHWVFAKLVGEAMGQ